MCSCYEPERDGMICNQHHQNHLAFNGGTIMENEYRWTQYMDYINWCGELTAKLDLGIPWVMCNGLSANNTIMQHT